jgi:hypothetical protein
MKALVVFESIFGNTQHIAEAIAEGLRGEVEVVEVGKARAEIAGVDLLVVGGPTHAWGMSRAMTRSGARDQAAKAGTKPVSEGEGVRDWLARLGEPRGTVAAAAFDTAIQKTGWFPSGSAAKGEAGFLRGKGYRLIAEPEQFLVKGIDGPLLDGELERAKAWGVHLAASAR